MRGLIDGRLGCVRVCEFAWLYIWSQNEAMTSEMLTSAQQCASVEFFEV